MSPATWSFVAERTDAGCPANQLRKRQQADRSSALVPLKGPNQPRVGRPARTRSSGGTGTRRPGTRRPGHRCRPLAQLGRRVQPTSDQVLGAVQHSAGCWTVNDDRARASAQSAMSAANPSEPSFHMDDRHAIRDDSQSGERAPRLTSTKLWLRSSGLAAEAECAGARHPAL